MDRMNAVSEQPGPPTAQKIPMPASAAKKITRILLIAIIALGGALLFAARVNPAHMDYISYWSAARLLVHHNGPYSLHGVFSLEKSTGFLPTHPLMMRNPPWALFLVAPLGFLGPSAGLVLWILATSACVVFSVNLLNPCSKDNSLALFFAPFIACIGSGQSSPFLLLGFALFLYFHRRRPFLAGASLLFLAFKPHLFLVFWAVLLAQSIYQRRFRILAGLAAALALTTAFALAIDPRVWPQYLSMLRASALDLETFPTASMIFRLLVSPSSHWLLFLPSAVAVLWGLWYYLRNRHTWDWTTHGMLLMLVTVLASPYGWFTDEIVLLPCLIFALNLPQSRSYAGWALLVVNTAAVIVFTAFGASLESPFLLWTPTAWLVWFLYATSHTPLRNQEGIPNLAT